MGLQDRVRVARRFQRSIRIDTDLGDPRSLEGFVCPRSSMEVLLTMARHVRETGHAAFTWTGPYGSGKSSLVIALGALLNGNERLRRDAASKIGAGAAKSLWEALPPKTKGWRILPVVGRRGSPAELVGEALVARQFLEGRSVRRWTDARIIEILTGLANAHPRSEGGLIVVLDEMGKFLEAAAQDGADIYLFQQLAEAASRSDGRFLVIGILHQAFDEYAQRLARGLRDEWAKVQGRFVDLIVNVTGDEQLDLLSRAIETDGRTPVSSSVAVVAETVLANRAASRNLAKILHQCWPLHPAVACLLGPISRRRFGQNQRSLFGFLGSAEPYGFQDFLRNASRSDLYGPDRLWDYLRTNLEPAILASPDGHRWSMAVEAVERCVGIGASELHIILLKTIALIDLFRERSGLAATPELLAAVSLTTPSREVTKALRDLTAWSFVLFRKHVGAYAIYAGSDFDIEGALTRVLADLREVNFKDLRALAGLQPILAKRHYHETGALRWFDIDLVSLADVAVVASGPRPEGGGIGRFLLAIPTESESKTKARQLCETAADGAYCDVVIGLSGQSWQVMQLAKDFLALNKIQEERPELAGDAVARREVLARLAELRTSLEADLQKMFETAEWFRRGHAWKRYSLAALNGLASAIADERYFAAPRLPNELVNRAKPSSNAVAAQKALLKRMVQGENEPRLGIEGFPAEGGLFESILLKAGIYRKDADQGWRFAAPNPESDPCRLEPAWSAAVELVSTANRYPVSMATLYACWQATPFGIKEGLLPILGVAFILAQKRQLAFYREGVFQARFTDLDVDYLASDPESIQVRWMDLSGGSRQLLSGLALLVRGLDCGGGFAAEPLDIARGLVAIYEDLKPWTKRTARLSSNALLVRDLFKHASDPNRFLLDDIPSLFSRAERGPAATEAVLSCVREGVEELESAYGVMLSSLQEIMLAELQVPNSPQFIVELRARAANIHQLSGDFRLNAFISRLAQFTGSQEDMEGIASLVVSKPPRDWVDADLDQARIELAAIAQNFIRTEAFARVKGRPDKRHAMAVVIGMDGRPTPVAGEFDIADSDRTAVEDVIGQVEVALKRADQVRRHIILAALAEISARYLSSGAEQSGATALRKVEP